LAVSKAIQCASQWLSHVGCHSTVTALWGETWSARKVFRRFLEHEREHYDHIGEQILKQDSRGFPDLPLKTFERRLNALELPETVEATDWRMEIGMLRLLESQYQALQEVRLD
jgi:hypothetical protein